MKKIIGLGGLVLLMSMSMMGCGSRGRSSNNSSSGSDAPSSTESDTTDYGKVSFEPIYIYCDSYHSFDEVPIRPIFTNPEACKNEVFEYEIKNEDVCYIENGFVYATGVNGSTKVTAKSQHLKGTFYVYSNSAYNNSFAFSTAKSLANTASHTTKKGTTLFIGDSFFEFWRNKTGIDENFATAFAGYDVANAGINGTQAREWRSLRKAIIDPYEPANVVINIGINDVDDNGEDGEATAGYIMDLCNDIWLKFPNCNIYYDSITRCAGYFSFKWSFHSQSNEIMKVNAQNNAKLHYIDIMEVWGDNYADYEQTDGLHPNTAGYEVMKNLIKAAVPLKTL